MTIKLAAVTAVVAVSLLFGSPAYAGEITGNGNPTPIKSQQEFPDAPAGPAASACAFSGLNDDPSEDGNRTQSWGTGIAGFIDFVGGRTIGAIISEQQGTGEDGPGVQCRGLPVNPFPTD